MAGGITLIKIHPKIWKWIQFPLSHVGSSTDEGMRKWWLSEHNQVSTGRKINGKKNKTDNISENGTEMYGFSVIRIFAVEWKLLERKFVFSLIDILGVL